MFTEEYIKDIHCGSGVLLRRILMNFSKEFINDTNSGSSEFMNWIKTRETDRPNLPTQDGEIDYWEIFMQQQNILISSVDDLKKHRYDVIPSNPRFIENEQKIGKPIIRIYEDEYGISIAYIPNRVETVYFFQKENINSFIKYNESKYLGIYFLVGKDNNKNTRVYVGQSQEISTRLNQHINKKKFWIDTYVLVSITNSLNKAQGDYLEKKFIELLLKSPEITLDNTYTYQKNNKNTASKNSGSGKTVSN
ncbi:GIY-YIG nuclease family protein [Anabaena sp. FACHB-1250]|nr:GIY-YIG nuclease family protein [Anabaena sp. FACHB-1250]